MVVTVGPLAGSIGFHNPLCRFQRSDLVRWISSTMHSFMRVT